jgi:hypothetical protein
MNELLESSLEGLHQNGGKHLELTQSDAAIQEYYELRQQLLKKQSDAIQAAVTQVQAEYQSELWQLEQEYGVYVSMITPAGDNS